MNVFQLSTDAIRQFMNAQAGFFAAEGLQMYMSALIIMVVWVGKKVMYDGMGFGQVLDFLMLAGIGFTIVAFYNTPIPLIGETFPHLITHQGAVMAQRIGMAQGEYVITQLAARQAMFESPSIFNVDALLYYIVINIMIFMAELVSFVVTCGGLVVEAVIVLLFPISVWALLVPNLDWFFWGPLKALFQYGYYQPVGAAIVYIGSLFLLPAMNSWPSPMTVSQLPMFAADMFIELGAYILVLLATPVVVWNIFSGSSGGTSPIGNIVTSAASAKVLG